MRLVELDRSAVTEKQIQGTDEYRVMCKRNDPARVLTACILFLRGDFGSLEEAIAQAKLQREVAHTAERELVVKRATMKWIPSGYVGEIRSTNSFVNLISGKGGVNLFNKSAEMNCWEAVIVAAFLNNIKVNPDKLKNLYTADGSSNFSPALVQYLAKRQHDYATGSLLSRPVMGDVVMFSGLNHVALATGKILQWPERKKFPEKAGGAQVISFWPAPFVKGYFKPGKVATVDLVTVEGIHQWIRERGEKAMNVTFGCPNWRALI